MDEALKALEIHKNKYRKYKTLFDMDLKNGDYVKWGECKGIYYVNKNNKINLNLFNKRITELWDHIQMMKIAMITMNGVTQI